MYRQIFIDGRPLPEDRDPSGTGTRPHAGTATRSSSRRPAFATTLWIDMGGTPMSDAAKMTERIRRPNYGTLEIEITVDDPKVFTRPWTVDESEHRARHRVDRRVLSGE